MQHGISEVCYDVKIKSNLQTITGEANDVLAIA